MRDDDAGRRVAEALAELRGFVRAHRPAHRADVRGAFEQCDRRAGRARRLQLDRDARMACAECIAPAQHERAQRVRADHGQRAGERLSPRHRRDESAEHAKRRSHERAPPAPARAAQGRCPSHHVSSAITCGSSSRSGPNTQENALPTPSSLRMSSSAVMPLHHVLDDRQAEAGAAGVARAAAVERGRSARSAAAGVRPRCPGRCRARRIRRGRRQQRQRTLDAPPPGV